MAEYKILVVSPISWTVILEDGLVTESCPTTFPFLKNHLNTLAREGWRIDKIESICIQIFFSAIDPEIQSHNDDKEKKDYLLFVLIKD